MNIYFDNNTLPNLVRAGVDPVASLHGSEFVISVTPDLATEYRQAIENDRVPETEKELCRRLLAAATERGIFGFAEAGGAYSGFDHGIWATNSTIETIRSIPITERPGKEIPKNRTDAFLVALADGAMVITNDTGSHFIRARTVGHYVCSCAEIIEGGEAPSDLARGLGTLLRQRS